MRGTIALLAKAIDRLLDQPVSTTGMRAFWRALESITAQELMQDLGLEPRSWREESPDGAQERIENAIDYLEDLASTEPPRHLAELVQRAQTRLRAFEAALGKPLEDEDDEDDDEEDEAKEDDEDEKENCKEFAYCEACGHILLHPRSIRRGLGPQCWWTFADIL